MVERKMEALLKATMVMAWAETAQVKETLVEVEALGMEMAVAAILEDGEVDRETPAVAVAAPVDHNLLSSRQCAL